MFKKLLLTLSILSLTVLTGCGPFWVNPYITVEESALNWMHIHYYNTRHTPIRRVSVYMNGTGLVEVRKGTSELISNDFAKKYKDANWSAIKSYRLQIDPARMNDIFQNLVNHGVLDRDKFRRGGHKDKYERFIAVKANISNITYSENVNIFEADPDLAEELLDVVREFENPAR